MKKLSVLIALALCITIGGVYAAWTYATGNATAVETEMGIAMGTKVEDSNAVNGTFTVVSTPTFIVEPASESDYTTTLVVADDSADLVIKFAPSSTASEDVKANAVNAIITIAISGNAEYNGAPIITVNTATNTATDELVWKNNDGTFTATISAETFKGYLTLAKNKLESSDAYDAYAAQLKNAKINITISVAE